ncbi:D-TA family PLP-dependent enzyme [Elizabethkingia anophelis]|uniref:D-threonine aldolase n=1 Tax=Elizabethkingia anophelis TaxID=1117645 RepID=A0A7Z7PXM0_9FLAO|nr:D-TA family PLP-dependent enzyme [Elizabethkingia anophelis]MCT3631436.1 D-TA family PLP-dependent enzyme [Elizabethkingia anophelis]MCT3635041.1 D-TA family PLP-dependent enzyme [Elizabethkingia anophelis]MCT3691009.1 D-TA family PLP-dependent enzyme [Elizabethkingia anophelis]MCT3720512.1 D-TA family PLP-dependent enzyme [Elizabethkingia anophelis]MCT3724022.1 D-TA family PLP-dependent enzyme [Elizabethkingia anophelis]
MEQKWWEINPDTFIDTPFLAIYPDRIRYNIEMLITSVNGDLTKLRPHIKTHKLGEILQLFRDYGIEKVKCATISEAELCALYNVPDILLAYQPAGLLKQHRWLQLLQNYPEINFSTIVDNFETVFELSKLGQNNNQTFGVYIDINTGMNRTGVDFKSNWDELVCDISERPNIQFLGIHIYDGHLHGTEEARIKDASEIFSVIKDRLYSLQQRLGTTLKIVAGGSGTFPFYATQEGVECSPGTFVFWDTNYQIHLPEQDFLPAAVLVGTIISKPENATLCIDIGYKAVASENPLDKRLTILNDINLIPVSQSEEHLVLQNNGSQQYNLGEIIYVVPYHICPTCALYETVQVVNARHDIYDQWTVLARKRKINI